MIWLIVAVVVVVLVVGLLLLSGGAVYKAIFSPEHYVEFAQRLAKSKQAACNMIGNLEETESPLDDPRMFLTSAGMAVMYSVDSAEGDAGYVHHLSLSIAGRRTPAAVGRSYLLYISRLLGIEPDRMQFGVSPMTVHHCEFLLNEGEQAAFAAQAIEVPSLEAAKQIHRECCDEALKMHVPLVDPIAEGT